MYTLDVTKRKIGVNFSSNDVSTINVWAPFADTVEMILTQKNKSINLHPQLNGYWFAETKEIDKGEKYFFRIDGSKNLPDPASLCQPDGVHNQSEVFDTSQFVWHDSEWKNIPLAAYIMYELHTGTFTPSGTFEEIGTKLEYLKTLGITAIEIMPVAQFSGERNWGYDGVYPFAVQNSYGGAEELQNLVDLCHQHGIAVVLDVVYNHLGPEGNYFNGYAPYFTDKHQTPWGKALNFDDAGCHGVRNYFIENALMWFRDFHIDALRLDAVHAIKDFGPKHFLQELKERVDELMKHNGRQHYLIAECDLNDVTYIKPIEENGHGMDAQWVDEFHHALRVTAGQQQTGYYRDFTGIGHLAKSYNDAYVYDGQFSTHRNKTFGTKAADIGGKQFVVFSQNHDQVGNRMLGERSSVLFSFDMQKLLAAAVLFSPFIPMLFMGEEYGETNPFLYFVSHSDAQLVEAVRNGRKAEFASFHADGEAPDPQSLETFSASKLQWELKSQQPNQTMFTWYKTLISLRKLQPALRLPNRKETFAKADSERNILWLTRKSEGQEILCLMNFSKQQQKIDLPDYYKKYKVLIHSGDTKWLGNLEQPDIIHSQLLTLAPESILAITNNIY